MIEGVGMVGRGGIERGAEGVVMVVVVLGESVLVAKKEYDDEVEGEVLEIEIEGWI